MASFIIGSVAGDTVGGVTAYYGTKYNNENTGLDLVTSIAVYGAGLKVSGDIIKDRITGKVLATWDAEAGGFVSGYGDYLGDKYQDVIDWYKTFKILPTTEIDTCIGSTVIVDNGVQTGVNTGTR